MTEPAQQTTPMEVIVGILKDNNEPFREMAPSYEALAKLIIGGLIVAGYQILPAEVVLDAK